MSTLEVMNQPSGLRRFTPGAGTRVVAVASGKGGVGKTHLAVNLSLAWAQAGRSVLLVDGDLGLANVDVLLGLKPVATLAQVMRGELELRDVLLRGPAGLAVVPAASGSAELAEVSRAEHSGLIDAVSALPHAPELLVIDAAPGIGASVTGFCQAADEIVVVVSDEPAALADAYALIKVLHRERGVQRFHLVCNRVRSESHGRSVHAAVVAVCERFLDVSLGYLGAVPDDPKLRQAAYRRCAVVDAFPSSPASLAFKRLAVAADKSFRSDAPSGQPCFFRERRLAGVMSGWVL